ncbi:MAG: nucleotidyl transferase AbiEii/AbiGii toxin family protein [Myxococcales bacterium]|nr:nucleotidyl transferase AbiEii/AbiGii toxin family protein [Myxococcales bacterium]
MIPADYITEWRTHAPWVQDVQVEQDLIIARAVVEMFNRDELASALAFRGGTALRRLFVRPPARYSEDIDLVQLRAEPIGPTLDALRAALDPWLGPPKRTLKRGRVVLLYRMRSEGPPPLPMKLKVEINSEEHFTVYEHLHQPVEISSRWFSGRATVTTYQIEELLGTKLRALYQRSKARDLFDLWKTLATVKVDPRRVVEAFLRYLEHQGRKVSRRDFEANLDAKLADPEFPKEVVPLLARGTTWDVHVAADFVRRELLSMIPERESRKSKRMR